MKPLLLRDRFAIGLRAMGFGEAKPTTHYRVFKKDGQPTFYLGKSGALRYSRTHKVTETFVAQPMDREHILAYDAVPTHSHRGFLLRKSGDTGMTYEREHGARLRTMRANLAALTEAIAFLDERYDSWRITAC